MTCRSRVLTTLLLAGAVVGMASAPASGGRAQGHGVHLRLRDGTPVTLIRGVEDEGAARAYRYLPVNLTIARRRDGMPEFSFLAYQEDSGGPIVGGIMHLLLRWGLTEDQETELQRTLRSQIDSLGKVVGSAPVRSREEDPSWEITSKGTIGAILNRSIASAGHVPTAPESKLAISFRFDARDAAKMSEALRGKRGAWGEKIRFQFTVDDPPGSRGTEVLWVLESDLGLLLPRIGG
jgi:hypothetical protein